MDLQPLKLIANGKSSAQMELTPHLQNNNNGNYNFIEGLIFIYFFLLLLSFPFLDTTLHSVKLCMFYGDTRSFYVTLTLIASRKGPCLIGSQASRAL